MVEKERYTEWSGGHGAGKPGKDCYTQLAKYEDSNLSPEEVMQLVSGERKVFILHGYWDTPDYDGVTIVLVTTSERKAKEALEKVADNKAMDYLLMGGYLQEERGERHYEVTNGEKYAKFYITEEVVDYEE